MFKIENFISNMSLEHSMFTIDNGVLFTKFNMINFFIMLPEKSIKEVGNSEKIILKSTMHIMR